MVKSLTQHLRKLKASSEVVKPRIDHETLFRFIEQASEYPL